MNYKIAGYDVDFPHNAYGVQLGFMEKVLRALDNRSNALLEAPTGSGKTLSLLCAALAWQRQQKLDLAKGDVEKHLKGELDSDVEEPVQAEAAESLYPESKPKQQKKCTRIYYATRTHSQIAQVCVDSLCFTANEHNFVPSAVHSARWYGSLKEQRTAPKWLFW